MMSIKKKKRRITTDKHAPRIAALCRSKKGMYAQAAFKVLRTEVVNNLDERKVNRLLVTGTTAGVGKSSVSINLASAIAGQLERRVILVDFDLRRPSIGESLGVRPNNGIETAAYSEFDIDKELIWIPELGFQVLAVKEPQADSSEILSSLGMKKVLYRLAHQYSDYTIIFDAPPVNGCDDVAAVSPYFPSVILVTEEGKTTTSEFNSVFRSISRTQLISIVSNKSKSSYFKNYYY